MVRRETLHALAELAPLSGPELEGRARGHRRNRAARRRKTGSPAGEGLVGGRGRTQEAHREVAGAGRAPRATPTASALLEDAVFNEQLSDDVRAGPRCPRSSTAEGGKALPVVNKLLASPLPRIRAGAALALGLMPRVPAAEKMLQVLIDDRDPAVLAAAAHAAERLAGQDARAEGRRPHRPTWDPGRPGFEAVNALVALEATGSVPRLAKQLTMDSDARCARGLRQRPG